MSDEEIQKEFQEARGHVLQNFAQLESHIDGILLAEIAPRQDRMRFVSKVLLNSMIIPFSNKLKVLRHLSSLNGWAVTKQMWKAFSDVMETRNQFAHAYGNFSVFVGVKRDKETMKATQVDVSEQFVMETISGSGQITPVNFQVALKIFNDGNILAHKAIRVIRRHVPEE